jgi:gluconate 2-dehydrogenase gamma chain
VEQLPPDDDYLRKGAGFRHMLLHRRELLASAAWLFAGVVVARASVISERLPWHPNAGMPPSPVRPGPWLYFSADEAAAVEALADRIIPPDPQTPGGKDSGCAVYLDRQMAGPYGRNEGLFREGPFKKGTEQQGPQSKSTLAETYRKALAALDKHCRSKFGGKPFAELSDDDKDSMLHDIENEKLKFEDTDAKKFFEQIIKDVQQGFFADPLYGGNRDMVAWKMIGFPGARYNYLDWIERHNERYPLPPVGIMGNTSWTPKS